MAGSIKPTIRDMVRSAFSDVPEGALFSTAEVKTIALEAVPRPIYSKNAEVMIPAKASIRYIVAHVRRDYAAAFDVTGGGTDISARGVPVLGRYDLERQALRSLEKRRA